MANDHDDIAASEQERFLDMLVEKLTPVNVYLVNGIRLAGTLVGHDRHVLLINSPAGSQMVYKHAISTVMPATGAGAPDRRVPRF